jgi:hypothetical protein
MDNKLWMYSVFIFLVLIAPIFLIMMLLVLTNIPLYFAFLGWFPVAILGSRLMIKWANRESQKLLGQKS